MNRLCKTFENLKTLFAPSKLISNLYSKPLRQSSLLFFLFWVFSTSCNKNVRETNGLFGQENAIWTESIYLRGYKPSTGKKLSDNDLKKYANTLKNNNIKYAYLFAGPYQEDGHLPKYSFSKLARTSVNKLKSYNPELIVLPWIGGVQNKTVYLGDSIWVKNALEDTKKLVNTLKTPGVHIDFEYILKGNPYLDTTIKPEKVNDEENYGDNVNSFHRKLRSLLPDSFISSVVVSTSPDTKPWKRKTSMEELSVLVKYVDQLSFLYYDTHINSQDVFEQNCVAQIRDIQKLQNLNTNTQFLLSVGTFVNRLELQKYRNLEIENIPNSLDVIKRSALEVSDSSRLVDGIAIFCDWETDEQEWKDFKAQWASN